MPLPRPLLDAHYALRGAPLPTEQAERLSAYAKFVEEELEPVTFEVDHRARPHLAHHDLLGGDPEEVVLNPAHRAALAKVLASGIATGPVARRHSWGESFALGYLTTDVGCFCSATVTMATLFSLAKYGSGALQERFLAPMLEGSVGAMGATWATEAQGGSDLGANRTRAHPLGDGRFALTGEKYFCSNVGAGYAVVTARPEGSPEGVRGLRLFFVPARRANGEKNWRVRRLKEKLGTISVPTGEVSLEGSEAYLLGTEEQGLVPVLDMLNVSRICNAVGSAGLLARAARYAQQHARSRVAFGRSLRDHPLLAQDLAALEVEATTAALLAFDPALAFDRVWKEHPSGTKEARVLRLATHAAKMTTAEQAVRGCYAALEIFGGAGYLEEFPLAKLVRDAMVLPIWEGGANLQSLDAGDLLVRSHPEEQWFADARAEFFVVNAPPPTQALRGMVEALEGGKFEEGAAKQRLRALSRLRQITLLSRLARTGATPEEKARGEAMLQFVAHGGDRGEHPAPTRAVVDAILEGT